MKSKITFGVNKTGIQMSPILSKEMENGFKEFPPIPIDTSLSPADFKQARIREANEVGSVPIPGSMQGALSTGLQMLKGEHPEILIDKLAERLAFERSGTRLYDALILKAELVGSEEILEMLRSIRADESDHFEMVRGAIESLGGDPTCQTPCADITGVQSQGLIQVLNDPRTTIAQCVQAILTAELTDNDGWILLIQLVRHAGLDEMANKFRLAKDAEDRHLEFIRSWLQELVLEPEIALKH